MDAKNVQSDLQALQRLYGFLKNVEDGKPNLAADSLDDNARLLLKNLLFKAHSEIIASKLEAALWALSPSYEQPTRLPMIGKSCSTDQDRKQDGLDITLWGENRSIPQGSQVTTTEDSAQDSVTTRGGPEYRTKRCRVCQKSTVKQQLQSIQELSFYDVAQNSDRFFDPNSEPKKGSSFWVNKTDDSNSENGNPDVEATFNKPEEADCLSKEASEAIKQIELCVSALQIGENYLFKESLAQNGNFIPRIEQWLSKEIDYPSLEGSSAKIDEMKLPYLTKPVRPNNTMPQASICQFSRNRSFLANNTRDFLEEHKLQNRGQNVKAINEKTESGNSGVSRNNFFPRQIPKVQKFSFPPDHNEISNRTPSWPITFSDASKVESSNQTFKDKKSRKGKVQANGKKLPPNSRWETLKDKKPAQLSVTKKYKRQQETESTVSSSDSSYGSSQEASSYGSDSEEYSSRSQTQGYETPSMSNESEASPLSQESETQYGSSTSNSDDDVYSPMSGNGDCAETSSISTKSKEYSSYDQPMDRHVGTKYLPMESRSTSRQQSFRRIRKPDKKQTGTWKKLKDKLSVIFHHHHHHHHHHHDDRKLSLQKCKEKASRSRRDNEAYAEKSVEKTRKSVIQDKNQKKHFHGLMEALLGHVRQSKKSKTAKEIGPLTKGQHGNKKAALKKSHWWQLLQQHREAKKTHAKLGAGKKKGLPKLK